MLLKYLQRWRRRQKYTWFDVLGKHKTRGLESFLNVIKLIVKIWKSEK